MPRMIHGKVTDTKGNPLAQARIYIKESPVPTQDIAMLTDNEGSFTLSVPAEGSYTIGSSADGFAPAEKTITVRDGDENRLKLQLGK